MPGDYTDAEVQSMSTTELVEARVRGWVKPENESSEFSDFRGAAAAAAAQTMNTTPTHINLGNSVPRPEGHADVWKSQAVQSDGYDFVCPSGQKCKMRKLQPERLLETGLLDKITRLEGLAEGLVQAAEGAPPQKEKMPSREDIAMLIDTVNLLLPMAVVEPKVYANDDDNAPEGAIRVSDVDIVDRVAIMEEALKGIRALDAFRKP